LSNADAKDDVARHAVAHGAASDDIVDDDQFFVRLTGAVFGFVLANR